MVRSSDVVSQLMSQPTHFWPFQASLTKQERSLRFGRLAIYIGVAYSIQTKDPQYAILAAAAAYGIITTAQVNATVDLSSAGLAKTPNPVGNAPVGDVTGRDPVAQLGTNLTQDVLIGRMQNPQEGYLDRAITATASPFDAPTVGGQAIDLGGNVNTRSDNRGSAGLANVATGRQLTVPPR